MPTAAVNIAAASTPPPKRLLFDRRYGWILDEWKEPSEEALSGGRGMFCVVPLAKALIQKASETVPTKFSFPSIVWLVAEVTTIWSFLVAVLNLITLQLGCYYSYSSFFYI